MVLKRSFGIDVLVVFLPRRQTFKLPFVSKTRERRLDVAHAKAEKPAQGQLPRQHFVEHAKHAFLQRNLKLGN